jgi:hypothetical protein
VRQGCRGDKGSSHQEVGVGWECIGRGCQQRDVPLKGQGIVVDAGNGSGGFFADQVRSRRQGARGMSVDSSGVGTWAGVGSEGLKRAWFVWITRYPGIPRWGFQPCVCWRCIHNLQVLAPLGANTAGSRYLDPDGSFPNHIPNPEAKEAMASAVEAVKEAGGWIASALIIVEVPVSLHANLCSVHLLFIAAYVRSSCWVLCGSGYPHPNSTLMAMSLGLRPRYAASCILEPQPQPLIFPHPSSLHQNTHSSPPPPPIHTPPPGADLGIVFDTDVDRSAIVDAAGEPINSNRWEGGGVGWWGCVGVCVWVGGWGWG